MKFSRTEQNWQLDVKHKEMRESTIIQMNQNAEQGSTSDSDSQRETDSSKVRLKSKTKSSTDSMTSTILSKPKMKTKIRKSNGRLIKRKIRKNIRIKGLDAIDFLHNHTLLSTASKDSGLKSPPPPGCVDHKFTALTSIAANTVPIHSELPPATYDTPYALQVLLDMFKEQFLAMMRYMKSDDYQKNVEIQIIEEKEKKQKLNDKLEQLEKQIHQLIGDSLKLLKTRMAELGVTNGYNAKDLIAKAKEIMSHHELLDEAVQLDQIPFLEDESAQFLIKNTFEECEDLSSKLKVSLSSAHGDDESRSYTATPMQQVKSEPLEDKNDDLSSPELQCQLNLVDCNVGTQILETSKEPLHNITSFSIILPRIEDVSSSQLLTPAQKKFANNESQVVTCTQDTPVDVFSLNNENKPLSENHDSTHRHRHKKSHKSKRKHKQHDSPTQCGFKEVKSFKFGSIKIPSAMDSIEDIITRTLNNNSGSSYTTREYAASIPPTTNYLNSSVMNGGSCSDKVDQADYRLVPPIKIKLKKYARENNYLQSSQYSSVMKTTVGDLVSSEIEKSLEISNRSDTNQSPLPLDYKTVNSSWMHKPWVKYSYNEQAEKYDVGCYGQQSSKSPLQTPSHIVPSPSYLSCKTSPTVKEEPFEGLAASMYGSINLHRSPEADNSQYSSPYCRSPINLTFKMSEPKEVPEYQWHRPTFNSTLRLPNEPSSFIDEKDQGHDNRWQDVSSRFDRMFEFASNKIVSYENVPYKDKVRSKLKDSIINKQTPTFALNPPPLFRADASFADSPPRTDPGISPYSPASLEGPFSPVPSLSPPALSSPVPTINVEIKDEDIFHAKFRPKGKGYKWL